MSLRWSIVTSIVTSIVAFLFAEYVMAAVLISIINRLLSTQGIPGKTPVADLPLWLSFLAGPIGYVVAFLMGSVCLALNVMSLRLDRSRNLARVVTRAVMIILNLWSICVAFVATVLITRLA